MLTRRKESNTYLSTVGRHHCSPQIAMKVDKMCLPLQLMKATALAESYPHFIYYHRNLPTPAMSTDSSQVGIALFPSC